MIDTILFPVDFSPACIGMAEYVNRVAALFQSRVTLLHVCDLESHNGFELYLRPIQEIAEEHWRNGVEKLEGFLKSEFPAPRFQRVLRSGDPAEEIVKFAHEGGSDLIILPTNAGRFEQILLGSTTAKVLDNANCMVMTTEHADNDPKPPERRHWVCGIGFGPESERVLRLATLAAQQAHAHLSLVHVDDRGAANHDPYCTWNADRQEQLERLANQKIEIVKGHIKEALLEAAQRPRADVLIIGRSPKHGIMGRLRHLTYELIRDSPVPVLSA